MSQPASMTPATTETVDEGMNELLSQAQELAAEDGSVLPAEWQTQGSATVATQPNRDDAASPVVVRIGDLELPEDEAKSLIERGRNADRLIAEADQRKAEVIAMEQRNAEAIELHNLIAHLPAEIRNEAADLIERRANGELAARSGYADIPVNAEVPTVKWDEMSAEAQMVYSLLMETISRLTQLGRIVSDMQPLVEEVTGRDENALIAQALKSKGFDATPEVIAKMKESGITDPVKAVEFFSPMLRTAFSEGAQKSEAAPKGPEVPLGNSNTYDDNDPNLTADMEIEYLNRGMVPLSGNMPPGFVRPA